MTQNAHVSAREPVCDILSDAPASAWSCSPGRCLPAPDSRMLPLTKPSIPAARSRNRTVEASPWIPPSRWAPSRPASAWYRRPCTVWSASSPPVSRCTVCHVHSCPAPSGGSPSSGAAASRHRHRRPWPTRCETSTPAASTATARTTLAWLAATISPPEHLPVRHPRASH